MADEHEAHLMVKDHRSPRTSATPEESFSDDLGGRKGGLRISGP